MAMASPIIASRTIGMDHVVPSPLMASRPGAVLPSPWFSSRSTAHSTCHQRITLVDGGSTRPTPAASMPKFSAQFCPLSSESSASKGERSSTNDQLAKTVTMHQYRIDTKENAPSAGNQSNAITHGVSTCAGTTSVVIKTSGGVLLEHDSFECFYGIEKGGAATKKKCHPDDTSADPRDGFDMFFGMGQTQATMVQERKIPSPDIMSDPVLHSKLKALDEGRKAAIPPGWTAERFAKMKEIEERLQARLGLPKRGGFGVAPSLLESKTGSPQKNCRTRAGPPLPPAPPAALKNEQKHIPTFCISTPAASFAPPMHQQQHAGSQMFSMATPVSSFAPPLHVA